MVVPFVLLGLYHLPAVLPPFPISRPPLNPYPFAPTLSVVSSFSGIYEGLATRTSGSTIQKPTKRGETWLFEVNLPTGRRVASSSLSSSPKQPSLCVRQCVVSRGVSSSSYVSLFVLCHLCSVSRVHVSTLLPSLCCQLGSVPTNLRQYSRDAYTYLDDLGGRDTLSLPFDPDFHNFPDWPGSRAKVDPSSVRADKLRERVTPRCDLHSTRTPTYLGVFRLSVSVLRSTRGKLTGKGWG